MIIVLRHYFKTHYKPSLILALHFLAFMCIHLLFVPESYLGEQDFDLAQVLLKGDVFIALILPILTIAFLEATMNRSSTKLLFAFCSYYAFLAGFSFSFQWAFTFQDFWFISLSNEVIFLYMIPFAVVVVYVFFRLVQVVRFNKKTATNLGAPATTFNRSTLLFITWTMCLLLRYLGLLLITLGGLNWWTDLIFIAGIVFMAVVYLYDPSAFYISNARIEAIWFFSADSGLLFYWYGENADDSGNLKVSGLQGADTLLREITGASTFPHLLMSLDRVVYLEYESLEPEIIAGGIIATEYNPALAPTLKRALSLFVKTYSDDLKHWNNNQDTFCNFTPSLVNVFDYAFSKEKRMECLGN